MAFARATRARCSPLQSSISASIRSPRRRRTWRRPALRCAWTRDPDAMAGLTRLSRCQRVRGLPLDPGLGTTLFMIQAASFTLAEEAVEAVIAAVAGDRAGLVTEAADVLYHLLIVLRSRDVPLDAVMNELERRTAQSGLAEKASRPR